MKKNLSLLLFAFTFIISCGIVFAADFSDVPATNENYLAIKYLQSQQVINGYADGTYKPDQVVNRAEAMKFILESNKVKLPETVEASKFSDVSPTDWFIKYLAKAIELKVVAGNPNGTFAPGRSVTKAEFMKMLLNSSGFKADKWAGQQLFPDVAKDAWYAAYMNYAGQAGIVSKDDQGNLKPADNMTRGAVAQSIYLLKIILNGKDTQFLLDQAELQMAQVENYIIGKLPLAAKKASELSVDLTQQALKNLPSSNVVLAAAKLARGYDYLVNAFITALQKKNDESYQWAQQAITKATEAWQANNEIQPIAKHIKERANEIIAQLPGAGTQQTTQQAVVPK